MAIPILRFIGERVLHKTVSEHTKFGGMMDIKLGFAMLKDRRVPFRPKLLSLGIAAGVMGLLIAVEFPLEWFLSIVLPVIGVAISAMTDGLETILGTLGVAALILPHIAPKALTLQMRNERAGIVEEPMPSVASHEVPYVPEYDLPRQAPTLLISKQ